MLNEMTPEQFVERWAHYLVDPWGDDWASAATIAASVENAVTRYAYSKAGRRPPDRAFVTPDTFIPRYRPDRKPDDRTREVKPENDNAGEELAAMLGVM